MTTISCGGEIVLFGGAPLASTVIVVFAAGRNRYVPLRQTVGEDGAPEFGRQSHEGTFAIRWRGFGWMVVVHCGKPVGTGEAGGQMAELVQRADVEAEEAEDGVGDVRVQGWEGGVVDGEVVEEDAGVE